MSKTNIPTLGQSMLQKGAGTANTAWYVAAKHLQPRGSQNCLWSEQRLLWVSVCSGISETGLSNSHRSLGFFFFRRANVNFQTCLSSALLYKTLCWDLTAVLHLLGPGRGPGQSLHSQGHSGQGSSFLGDFSSWAQVTTGERHWGGPRQARWAPPLLLLVEPMTSAWLLGPLSPAVEIHQAPDNTGNHHHFWAQATTTTIFFHDGKPPRSVLEYEIFQGRRLKTRAPTGHLSRATGHMYYIFRL